MQRLEACTDMCMDLKKKLFSKKKKKQMDDDSNVDAVIARNLWKNHRILPPSSPFKARWDMVMMVLVVYNCIYIPLELFFLGGIVEHGDYPKAIVHEVIDYCIDALFITDIFLNSCTAYYDEEYAAAADTAVAHSPAPCACPHARATTHALLLLLLPHRVRACVHLQVRDGARPQADHPTLCQVLAVGGPARGHPL